VALLLLALLLAWCLDDPKPEADAEAPIETCVVQAG
jgi:hypothetical protein